MLAILRRPAARRVGLRLTAELAARSIQLLVLVAVARTLGESTFGTLMVGATAGLIAAQLADVGLTLVVGADVARRVSRLPSILTSALLVKSGLWGVSLAMLLGLFPLLGGNEDAAGGVIIAAAFSLDTFVQFSAGVLRAARLFKLDWLVALLPRAAAAIAVIPVAVAAQDPVAVAIAWLCGAAVAAGASTALAVTAVGTGRPARDLAAYLLRRGWPVGLSIVAGMIYTRMAIFYLDGMRSSEEVAVYVVALRLLEPAYVLPAAAGAIFYPAYASLVEERDEAARRQLRRWILAIAAIAATTYVTMAVAGEWVAALLFGDFFRASGALLRGLALVLIPGFVSYVLNQALIAQGAARYNLMVMTMLVVVGAVLNPLAISEWGVAGAAGVAVGLELLLLAAFLRRSARRETILDEQPSPHNPVS